MFKSEEKHRKVVERIIAETQAGNMVWRERTPPFECSYIAEWKGWKILATYFQDETSVEMARGSERVGMSYRVMEGLKEAILFQLDPNWKEHQEQKLQKLRQEGTRRSEESNRLVDKFLAGN